MVKVIFATLASVVAAGDLSLTWSDCGAKHAVTTDVSPAVLTLGAETAITGTGTLDEDLTGGTYDMELKAGGGLIDSHFTGNNCEAKSFDLPLGLGKLNWDGIACPLKAGTAKIGFHVTLASSLPAALATSDITLNAGDQNAESTLCVKLHLAQTKVSAQEKKHYAKGFVRMPRNANAAVAVAEITDEMRAAVPDSLDWSTKGATTPVKDQGQCGSCWAYSATEGIESGLFMAGGVLEDLSEQQIISCDKTDGGCNGGDLPTAFEYVMNAGGIDSRSDYPDTSATSTRTGSCKSFQKKVKVTGYKYAIPPCDSGACTNQQESDLMAALNTYGPLSVCVNAETWNDYQSGIYTATCSGSASMLDHCVQLVGYDKVANYWKVRNSWAADWGEDGFIRLPMGKNACGIADEATYVTAMVESSAVEI